MVFEDFLDGQGDDGFAGFAEEGGEKEFRHRLTLTDTDNRDTHSMG